jgi:hypothetical protein
MFPRPTPESIHDPVDRIEARRSSLVGTSSKCVSGFCQAYRGFAVMICMTLVHSLMLPQTVLAGNWTVTGSLTEPRDSHTATLVANGQVLVAGGWNGSIDLNSAELYDPGGTTARTTGTFKTGRDSHTATLLTNGKVLVAGGWDTHGNVLTSAEIYDPGAGRWNTTGSLNTGRYYHTATLLTNGKVLAAGGRTSSAHLNSAELYDPKTANPALYLLLLED